MKRLLLLVLLAFGIGCQAPALNQADSNNAKVQVEHLVDVDGCTVYRFYDEGTPHYFARCPESTTVSNTRACGKGCVRQEEITTTR